MYITKIAIKNNGPIGDLCVDMPFTDNDLPKPIIFVGENGTGKTVLQSCIIDFLYELGGSVFEDVRIKDGTGYKYFKTSGGMNRTHGKNKSFVLVQAECEGKTIEYYDKSGQLSEDDFISKIPEFTLSSTENDENIKGVSSLDESAKKIVRDEWMNGAFFHQPAYRYEEPFWKNDAFLSEERFVQNKKFTNHLNKELEILSSMNENRIFMLDLVLDFSIDGNNVQDKTTWDSANQVLRKILRKESIRFGIGPRSGNRISIVNTDTQNTATSMYCPSISNLSLGESVLLNLFVNIIRHAGNKPCSHEEISGIVLIDEVDVHLHTSLQFEVLPGLLKLFPKIQFIFTTHSPLFLLGMDKAFGSDGFEVREMPTGKLIGIDRFSEFEYAYEVFKQTQKFEEDIRSQIESISKPVVFVEGPTDVIYIKKAFELFNKEDLLEKIDIKIVGIKTNSGTKNSNDVELLRLGKVLKLQPTLVNKKVLILHDPESKNVVVEDIAEQVFIRQHKLHPESKIKNGIENLFDSKILEEAEVYEANYFSSRYTGNKQVEFKISKNKKMSLCKWICENSTKSDFINFEYVVGLITNSLIEKDNQLP